MDPPYALVREGELGRTLALLRASSVLTEGTRVVLEHAASDTPPTVESGWLSLEQTRRYGDTAVSLYRAV